MQAGRVPRAAHTSRYYARPDVAYLTIVGAPSLEWAFTWRRAAETDGIRPSTPARVEIVDAAKSAQLVRRQR